MWEMIMRLALVAVFAAMTAACAEVEATSARADERRAGKERAAKAESDELQATVTKIVREFAEDPNAQVKVEKTRDIMVCGTVATNGVKKRFSVDLVDEEAFFADDGPANNALVSTAC